MGEKSEYLKRLNLKINSDRDGVIKGYKHLGKLRKLMDAVAQVISEEARDNYYVFYKTMLPHILPTRFVNGRHLRLICSELQDLERSIALDIPNKTRKLMLFTPPGHSKTLLCTVLFVSWCMGRNPNWNILAIGSDIKFATDKFGRAIKRVMETEAYKKIFPEVMIRQDSDSAQRWITNMNGEFFTTGVGSNIVGRRATLCGTKEMSVYEKTHGKIKLEHLKVGDEILGPKGFELVTKCIKQQEDVVFKINNQVDVSGDHPFKIKNSDLWIEAKNLHGLEKIEVESLWKKLKRKIG